MATPKDQTTKTEDTKAQTSQPTKWEFTEDFDTSIAPPEGPVRRTRSTALPFADKFFEPAKMVALEGKKPHKFIAKDFFMERAAEMGGKPEKVNGAYMKAKVRDAFNKWKKTQGKLIQDSLELLLIERSGKEEGFPQAGLSVWILTAEKKPSTPAAG